SDHDVASDLAVDAAGVITIAGDTMSKDYPTTAGAWDRSHNGGGTWPTDAFVSRLDPSKPQAQQLTWSTYLGGSVEDAAFSLSVDSAGVATVCGWTSSPDYPTTAGAYDTTYNGAGQYPLDAFVARLDPARTGPQQLLYSTFVGGSD